MKSVFYESVCLCTYCLNDVQHVVGFSWLRRDDSVQWSYQTIAEKRNEISGMSWTKNGYTPIKNRWLVVLQSGGQGDWLPGVVALPDGGGILIAERQEVEELSQVEQGFNVILKCMVSHSWEQDMRRFLDPKDNNAT